MVSNATRWDTFESMMGDEQLPPSEAAFRKRYQKSPSFLSIHMGVYAELLPEVRVSGLHVRTHGLHWACPQDRKVAICCYRWADTIIRSISQSTTHCMPVTVCGPMTCAVHS